MSLVACKKDVNFSSQLSTRWIGQKVGGGDLAHQFRVAHTVWVWLNAEPDELERYLHPDSPSSGNSHA
jgi:hypothetical protein